MIETAQQILNVLSIGCVVAVFGSLLSALAYPAFRVWIRRCHPVTRSLIVVCYGFVSPAVAVTVVALIMHPDYAQLLVPGHCHHGACGSHAPVVDTSSVGGLGLVGGGSLLLVATLFAGAYGFRLAQRRLRMLFRVARQERYREYLIVESPDLFAWCCGVWRSTILVSRGLVQRLSSAQLQLVLAHERAHGRRLDNLRAAVLRWLTVFWPRATRARIRTELANDIEMACDLEVTCEANRADYIGVLQAMTAGTSAMAAGARGTSFACAETEQRIEALANPETADRPVPAAIAALCVVWLVQIATVSGLTHYFVEWIVSLGG